MGDVMGDRMSVRFPPGIRQRCEDLATQEGITPSVIVRLAVRDYLQKRGA